MSNSTLIQTITIPRYLTRIQISKARRAKYYRSGDILPKKYQNLLYNKQGFLINSDGERIISNPRVAGSPKFEILSGNRLTTGYSSPYMRNRIAYALKLFYTPFVKSMRPITKFPIRIEWDFYTTINRSNFDLSNFWFYLKYFEDTLVIEEIIPDDTIEFITHTAAAKLIPVAKFGSRKFVFRFYHDNRPELQGHELWNPGLIKNTNEN